MLEFENDTSSQENRIADLLKKSEDYLKEGKVTRKSSESGGEEFLFSKDGTGLVFDSEAPASETEETPAMTQETFRFEPLVSYEKNAPRVEEVNLVAKSEGETIALETPADTEEFSLPSSFTVDDKYNTPILEERRSFYSTYVPKFTEASENYRMADQPRPKKSFVKPAEPAVDPTAEEEKETEGAVVVGVGDTPASAEAIVSISKPAPAPVKQEQEDAVEEEKRKIEALFIQKQTDPVPETPAVAENEPVSDAPEAVSSIENKEYAIPDPEEPTVRIFDYPQDVGGASALPAEKVNEASLAPRRLFAPKEYESVTQKMAFKDIFLDRLNSVAVRMGAALILTLVLFALENMHLIGVDAVAFLGFKGYPFLLGLLDLQITLCLLLFATPEIMRAFRALTKGYFHTPLLLPIAFALQMFHTVTVLIKSPSVEVLYGFVFGLLSLATIVGSYLRHHSSFITFRHVGGREEKIAVDKKLTRMLDKEKFALDGAVDEYKSKTSRFVHASFISDFFARERKSAEDTRYNLKYLLISLGISFVCAVVMFFVGNGMLDASSTMTVTFYLCAPAALLLSHRLPFYISVREASGEGGGIIGETSHYDYAGVDVVTFKDTEIFEKGDVALKHIILYDTSKEFTAVVEQMSSLFSVIGGPLDVLFSSTLVRKSPMADEAVLENGGIRGRIGSLDFHVGSAEYLSAKGIALPKEKDNRESVDPGTKIMYAAENGRIYAKFYLQYNISSSYEALLRCFAEEKIVSLVYTRDFNITDALMLHLAGGRDLIRVLLDMGEDPDAPCEKISVGVVSSKSKADAISLLLLCRRYVRLRKNIVQALWLVLGSGAFLGIMLSLFGLVSLPSGLYGVWQIGLVVAMLFYCRRFLAKSGKNAGGKNRK